ncbi:hypothetical protein KHA80_22725 [Anaerobacillus sp. HL2]|nr:hypothetical protein KHA80_22725 [Anaerobacillus sp. HL2]
MPTTISFDQFAAKQALEYYLDHDVYINCQEDVLILDIISRKEEKYITM